MTATVAPLTLFYFVEIIRLRRPLFFYFGVRMMVPLEDFHFQTTLQLHNCVMFFFLIFFLQIILHSKNNLKIFFLCLK